MKRVLWIPLLFGLLAMAGETEPPPAPLDWAVGSWHGVRTDASDGDQAPMSLLIERLEVASGGDPYVGFTVRTPDPRTGRWVMLYANDVRSKVARLEATFDGDRVVWNSRTAVPPRGSRLVAERLGPDRWRRTQQISKDGGATWSVLFVDELERGKAAP